MKVYILFGAFALIITHSNALPTDSDVKNLIDDPIKELKSLNAVLRACENFVKDIIAIFIPLTANIPKIDFGTVTKAQKEILAAPLETGQEIVKNLFNGSEPMPAKVVHTNVFDSVLKTFGF